MTSTPLRGALGALALVLLASPALAQPAAADPSSPRAAEHQRMHEMMAEHQAMMAQDLHTILNIRPNQEAAFSAFQASMTPPPHDWGMKPDRAAMQTMTTPQRLDMMAARMDARMGRMRAHIQAVKTFYAALSPEQQRTFDALARMHGLHGLHGDHGMHGGWGGHDHGMRGPGEGPPPPPGA